MMINLFRLEPGADCGEWVKNAHLFGDATAVLGRQK